MKGLFVFIFVWFCISNSNAINYYLSQSGNDNNSGTSALDPWQTIAKLNSTVLQPGDSVLFEAGSIFRGEIIISNSGNEGQKIYFGKYGTGNLPVISGAELISGWSLYSGNIYKATLSQTPSQLFADEKRMTIARFPNSGYLQFTEGLDNTGFTCSSLNQQDSFWNNATIIMRTTDRKWEVNKIKTFANQTALFITNSENNINSDYNFYLRNLKELIDTANEWYFDIINQQLLFNAPDNIDPSLITTESSFYNNGMILQNNASHITIENIEFAKQVMNGIQVLNYSTNIRIISCTFNMQGETGIQIPNGASDCEISENSFNNINGNSLSISNSKILSITNNKIKNNGITTGYGLLYYPDNMYAMDFVNSDSFLISFNTVDSSGGPAILCDLENSTISKNIFSNCILNLNLLGAVFMYRTNNSILESNIIMNSIGIAPNNSYPLANVSAVYSEDTVIGNSLTNNTIGFASSGMSFLGVFSSNIIRGNIIYGCNSNALNLIEGEFQGSNIDNQINSNVLFGLNEYSDLITLKSEFAEFVPAKFDSNYYFNPYNFYFSRIIKSPGGIDFPKYYNLNLWKKETNSDSNSRESFFYRNRIITSDTLQENFIPNSFFTNNFDGWINLHPDSTQMLLDNSTVLDYGCLKLSMLLNDPDINTSVIAGNFEIDSNKYYQFGFSCVSDYSGFIVIKFQKNNGDYGYFNNPIPLPFGKTRSNYSCVIQPFNNSPSSRVNIEIDGSDSTLWIDNVTLFPVNAIEENPEKKCRLFINTTDVVKNFNLGDSVFYNLDQQIVVGSIALQPYSSTILIFDSSLISTTQTIIGKNEISVFPNPVPQGGILHLQFPLSTGENEILIYDINGKILFQKKNALNNESQLIQIPASIEQGIYFIQIKQNENVLTGKIVVM